MDDTETSNPTEQQEINDSEKSVERIDSSPDSAVQEVDTRVTAAEKDTKAMDDEIDASIKDTTMAEIHEKFSEFPDIEAAIRTFSQEDLQKLSTICKLLTKEDITSLQHLGDHLQGALDGSVNLSESIDGLDNYVRQKAIDVLKKMTPEQKTFLNRIFKELSTTQGIEGGIAGIFERQIPDDQKREIVSKGKKILAEYQKSFDPSANAKNIEYQRAIVEAKLMMVGVDTSGGIPKNEADIKTVNTTFEKMIGFIFGLMKYFDVMFKKAKGERLENGESSSEKEKELIRASEDDKKESDKEKKKNNSEDEEKIKNANKLIDEIMEDIDNINKEIEELSKNSKINEGEISNIRKKLGKSAADAKETKDTNEYNSLINEFKSLLQTYEINTMELQSLIDRKKIQIDSLKNIDEFKKKIEQ